MRNKIPNWASITPTEIVTDILGIGPGTEIEYIPSSLDIRLLDYLDHTDQRVTFRGLSSNGNIGYLVSLTGGLENSSPEFENLAREYDSLTNKLSNIPGIIRPLYLSPIDVEELENRRLVYSRYMVSNAVEGLCTNMVWSRDIPWEQRLEYVVNFAISGLSTLTALHRAGWVHGRLSRSSFADKNEPMYGEDIFTVLMDFSNACFISSGDCASQGRSPRDDLVQFGDILLRVWNEDGYERNLAMYTNNYHESSPEYQEALVAFKNMISTEQIFWLSHEDPESKAIDDFLEAVRSLGPDDIPPYTYLKSLFLDVRDR